MSEIAKQVGERIKKYRIHKGITQEKLAEMAGCHPTYIGQIERGEKNPTVESVYKITQALGISLSELFRYIDSTEDREDDLPRRYYELMFNKKKEEQARLIKIMEDISEYGQ